MRPAISANSNVLPPSGTIAQAGPGPAATGAADALVRATAGQARAHTSLQPQAPRPSAVTRLEIETLEAEVVARTREQEVLDAEVALLRLKCAEQQARAASGDRR